MDSDDQMDSGDQNSPKTPGSSTGIQERKINQGKNDQLVLLSEHCDLVARVNSGLSTEIYKRLIGHEEDSAKEGFPSGAMNRKTRVSEMFMSRYGIMGYAEYTITHECLGGIILFPKKLSLLLQLAGESVWDKFTAEYFNGRELEKHVEKLEDARHEGVRFLDEKYYWACHPDYSEVGGQMIDQVRGISSTIVEFLKRLDKGIDKIRGYTPENPSSDFNGLQERGLSSG